MGLELHYRHLIEAFYRYLNFSHLVPYLRSYYKLKLLQAKISFVNIDIKLPYYTLTDLGTD